MGGWYNPLPIRQSTWEPARRKGIVSRRSGEKGSPGCWAGAGSKLQDTGSVGPRYNSFSQVSQTATSPPFLELAFLIDSYRSLSPPTPPPDRHPGALIATSGHICSNDLPGKGCDNITNASDSGILLSYPFQYRSLLAPLISFSRCN